MGASILVCEDGSVHADVQGGRETHLVLGLETGNHLDYHADMCGPVSQARLPGHTNFSAPGPSFAAGSGERQMGLGERWGNRCVSTGELAGRPYAPGPPNATATQQSSTMGGGQITMAQLTRALHAAGVDAFSVVWRVAGEMSPAGAGPSAPAPVARGGFAAGPALPHHSLVAHPPLRGGPPRPVVQVRIPQNSCPLPKFVWPDY
jgi:hypothetical protein